MQVGDLVRHWRCDHGLGIIVATVLPLTGHVHPKQETETNHNVVWPDGECGWYTTCRLQKVAKCK